MKTILCAQEAPSSRRGASKFNSGLYPFAAAAPEEHLAQFASSKIAKPAGKVTGQLRYVALQHRRTATVHFIFQCLNNVRMVVSNIVNTVSGEVIENTPAVRSEKLGSKAPVILHIHLQNIKE